jgi:hypothetical protein
VLQESFYHRKKLLGFKVAPSKNEILLPTSMIHGFLQLNLKPFSSAWPLDEKWNY